MRINRIFLGIAFGLPVGFSAAFFAHTYFKELSKSEIVKPAVSEDSYSDTAVQAVVNKKLIETVQQTYPENNTLTEELYPSRARIADYASEHSITTNEAELRVQQLDKLSVAIEGIVVIEEEAVAGWGVDDTHGVGPSAWIWFVGDHQLEEASLAILEKHPEIDTQYFAKFSRKQLIDTNAEFLRMESENTPFAAKLPPDWNEMIAHTYVDLKANAIVIVLYDDPGNGQSSESMMSVVEGHVSAVIDVPYIVKFRKNDLAEKG